MPVPLLPPVLLLNADGTETGWNVDDPHFHNSEQLNACAVLLVNAEMWVLSNQHFIMRYTLTGTLIAGPLPLVASIGTHEFFTAASMVKAGDQVWVINQRFSSILRLNLDGSSAGGDLLGNGLFNPRNGFTVGSQIWVANATFPTTLSRFNFDGTSAGIPIALSGSLGRDIGAVINAQFWALSYALVGKDSPAFPSTAPAYLEIFAFDGTLVHRFYHTDWGDIATLAQVGDQVWLLDAPGERSADLSIEEPGIHRLGLDGTTAAPDVDIRFLGGTGGEFGPFVTATKLYVIGPYVWVAGGLPSILVLDFSGAVVRTGPSSLGTAFYSAPHVRVAPARLPPVRIGATSPSGGASGDGVTTLGLVAAGATLTATVDTALRPTIWYLIIFDEAGTVLSQTGFDTSVSWDAWIQPGTGPASHTYQAVLSDAPDLTGTLVAYTNSITVSWP